MMQPTTGMDSERCAFCHELAKLHTSKGNQHRNNCLDLHSKVIEAQPRKQAITERKVLVETRGQFLGSRVFAISLDLCTSSPEAFRTQVMWRIWHILDEGEDFELEAKRNKIGLEDLNGMRLNAGDVVQVMVAGDTPDQKPKVTSFVSDATASVEAYGASDNYDARQNAVAYVISEFIDNALMAAINMDGSAGIPMIKVWILVSDDGKQMAIAIEVCCASSHVSPRESPLFSLTLPPLPLPRPSTRMPKSVRTMARA